MAHCPPENLSDIAKVLEQLRALPAVVEKKPGIFYIKSDGFLHFHLKDARRYAHVKTAKRGSWQEVPLDFDATAAAQKAFIAAVKKLHAAYLAS